MTWVMTVFDQRTGRHLLGSSRLGLFRTCCVCHRTPALMAQALAAERGGMEEALKEMKVGRLAGRQRLAAGSVGCALPKTCTRRQAKGVLLLSAAQLDGSHACT